MASLEAKVAGHYTHGALQAAIEAGWATVRAHSKGAPVDQLAGVDEFHIGGRVATEMVCARIDLGPGLKVLDIGCGLGGAARFMASRFDVEVEGIDLTPEYVEVGNGLSREVGLDSKVHLTQGSALNLQYEDAYFDRATQFHVGMNIEDKARLFAQIARVLKPGALFAVYDVMRVGDGTLDYPVAWAEEETTSFVAAADAYEAALVATGFRVVATEPQGDLALAFFARMKARMAEHGTPPLGLHLVMGKDAATKVANMVQNIARGAIAPVLMLASKA
ncbi:MAG: methyltransferase domain-containing protein [Alphaproteobacteria bacterium]|nr:methyltransferase domain-containing protein [Alphaproteobacteria bacterium]